MKKVLFGLMALIFALTLSACGNKDIKVGSEPLPQAEENNSESGGIISSIKDAMGIGKKLECTYKMGEDEESITTKTFIEGKKYKGQVEMDGKIQNSIFDGDMIYTWAEGETKGTKMSMNCMKEIGEMFPPEEGTEEVDKFDPEKLSEEAFDDATDVNCVPVDSIDFSVPDNVVFADQCDDLKKMMQGLKDMQNKYEGMPAGITPTD